MEATQKVQFCETIKIVDVLDMFGIKTQLGTDRYFCPFHDDNDTPNLSVDERRNFAYCFRCNTGGNPIYLAGLLLKGKGSRIYGSGGSPCKEVSWSR